MSKHNIKTQKGQVFTIDALMAILLLAVFLAYFQSFPSPAASTRSLALSMQANDALAALDKNATLASANASRINSTLSSLLDNQTRWSISVQYYNYTTVFNLNQTVSLNSTAGPPLSSARSFSAARRTFVVMQNNTARYYGAATLQLWQR